MKKLYLGNLIDEDAVGTDSMDEIYFEWFLDELKKTGYIESYYRGCTINLSDPVSLEYNVQLKTKTAQKSRVAISGIDYTPDYVIVWDKKAEGIFYKEIGVTTISEKFDKPDKFPMFWANNIYPVGPVSVLDVKPNVNQKFVKFTSSHTFVVKQAMTYMKYGLVVDKVKVQDLFKKTFTPSRYLLTDKSKELRKIKWVVKTLKDYVSQF
jgi:hypothetical protein